jgi:hypothetical protein
MRKKAKENPNKQTRKRRSDFRIELHRFNWYKTNGDGVSFACHSQALQNACVEKHRV